ncbi:hypothetical protein BAUCODRAFT_147104 [Baudoinia panamericana UAMH 10762]|uniref:Uncharacterized protein n=1 Tax=Baudoinia panamericana (strain UAMH 10762) TaxID=717646 RepID=M2NCJ6_BAUPA|nr:uncharacterized protein BAUCODRAFT_147104 [Baudoinia panamericana UAMH 10762]EMC96904.1 hypothetical protein BAUCODRAFT_147104 [Baudoinia panamericana UAMH 10762]
MDGTELRNLAQERLTADTNDSPERQPDQSKLFRDHILPWWFTVCCLILSLACLLAIVALLAAYEGKQVPTWNYLGGDVTFNSVISWLAQIARAALAGPTGEVMGQLRWSWLRRETRPRRIEDFQAYVDSSGPLGALKILLRSLKSPLTFLGAFLIIVLLAFEPFLQNIPTYPLSLIRSEGAATIPRTTSFTAVAISRQGADFTGNALLLNATVKGAFYGGSSNLANSADLTSTCPSGNCTWPTYTSLGIAGYGKQDMSWHLPGLNGFGIAASQSSMGVKNGYPTVKFANLQNYSIVDFISIYYPAGNFGRPSNSAPATYGCILYFRVNSYSALVANGHFIETLDSSFPEASTVAATAAAAIKSPAGGSGPASRSTGQLTATCTPSDIKNTIVPPLDAQSYHVDNQTFTMMRLGFQSVLTGAVNANAPANSTIDDVSQVLIRQAVINIVEPHWPWLILPMATIVLALLSILATMIHSNIKRIPAWGTSTLPSLVYGLDAETASVLRERGPRQKMLDEMSKKYAMSMSRDAQVWKLQGVQQGSVVKERAGRVRRSWMKGGRK